MPCAPIRKPPEEEDSNEHADSREPSRHLAVGSRDEEDARESIDEERALVVEERREVEGEARPVLVAAFGRDRVGVVRDRRLVAEEAGRVVRRDPELKGADARARRRARRGRASASAVRRARGGSPPTSQPPCRGSRSPGSGGRRAIPEGGCPRREGSRSGPAGIRDAARQRACACAPRSSKST